MAVGLDMLAGDPRHAEDWNRTVLEGIGGQINHLSFHIYQPSEEGYQAEYDPETLYHNILSAPYSVEDALRRMARLLKKSSRTGRLGLRWTNITSNIPHSLKP